MKRAALYSRVSLDREGISISPERQELLCRQKADAKGYTVVEELVFTDRNLSAYARGVKRPGFTALIKACKERKCDVVMLDTLARLSRRASEILLLRDTLEANGIALVLNDIDVDTSTPTGKMLFGQLAGMVEWQSAETSWKVKAAHKQAAARGEAHRSGPRGFGFQKNLKHKPGDPRYSPPVIDEREAEYIREVTRRLLAKDSLSKCAAWLNAEGVKTTGNGDAAPAEWNGQTLSQMLRAPRLAGLRQHGGDILPGDWEAILTEATWFALLAELDSRIKTGNGRAVQAHLLTGLIKCGRCGCNLKAMHFRQANGKIFDRYQCRAGPGLKSCGRMAVSKRSVDEYVIGAWLDAMSAAYLQPVDTDDRRDLTAEIAAVTAQLAKIARDHYVLGRMPDDVFGPLHDELSLKLTELHSTQAARQLSAGDRAGILQPGNRQDMEAWWNAASLDERRVAMRRVYGSIELLAAKHRGGRNFDADRLVLHGSNKFYTLAFEAGTLPDGTAIDEAGNLYDLSFIGPAAGTVQTAS